MHSYQEAVDRIPSHLEKIVKCLREAGEEGVTNFELSKITLKYDSRISDLRRKGYIIDTIYEGKGRYKYIIRKVPSNNKNYMNAHNEILMIVDKEFKGVITKNQLSNLLDEKYFHITRKSGWYKQRNLFH